MGSSVFHGGFSTLIAVLAMAPSQVYYFVVFFKTWLLFISFGLLNGMILQPIILSLFGPVYNSATVVSNAISSDVATEKDQT